MTGARVQCDLPYVNSFRDRHGRWRYYFRRKGNPRATLPGEPGSPEFVAAYHSALASEARVEPSTTAKLGSLDALRELYLASAEFLNLAESTRRETRYALDAICREQTKSAGRRGENPVAMIERRHILAWRDKLASTSGAANKMLRTIKGLLSFAVQREFRADNPAQGIKFLKIGRFRAWTDGELAEFEARWPVGSRERLGYALALYTGQRRADLVAMKWSAITGAAIRVRQSKTKTDLEIPLHPDLRALLALVRTPRPETILTTAHKKPMNAVYFGHFMARAIEDAGLSKECVLHGLRKTTARIVAETGGDVSSMTGHLSDRMVKEYSRDASQKRMAKSSVVKWSRARPRKGA